MNLLTSEFAIFVFVVVAAFYLLPPRLRWILLLVAGYFFYAKSEIAYVPIIIALTLCNFGLAFQIVQRGSFYLWCGVFLNLTVLVFFKYTPSLPFKLTVLPLGLSYLTFQHIGYLVDIHRKRITPEHHLGLYALFGCFFPILSAGPIERADHLLPQFRKAIEFDETRTVEALRLILWGSFKKIVIADQLAAYVNPVYSQPQNFKGLALLTATFFFAFQIYCDFSAYSDLAVGIGKLMGFDLILNFRQPYFAWSVREFWQRWHISLSLWIREFLFMPLSRFSLRLTKRYSPRFTQLLVTVVVMGLVGLWHGASWTFLIWGGLHGLYLALETTLHLSSVPKSVFSRVLRGVMTFLLVSLAWIFFRAESVHDAFYIITHILRFDWTNAHAALLSPLNGIENANGKLTFLLLVILLLLFIDFVEAWWGFNIALNRLPLGIRWALYYGAVYGIIFWGVWGEQLFIYAGF